MGISLHTLRTRLLGLLLVEVLDKAQVERAAAILVTLELGDGSLGVVFSVKSDDARASGAAARLILDLSLFHLANSSEELDKVFIAGRPGQLETS